MITNYFEAPRTVERMRASCVGTYLDDLAAGMAGAGYRSLTICEHLRTVVEFARWAQRRRIELARWDEAMLAPFRRHLVRRRLTKRQRAVGHVLQLFEFLRARGLISPAQRRASAAPPPIVESFGTWMLRHRGITSRTLNRYRRVLSVFVAELGQDPGAYKVATIRAFVVEQLGRRSRNETREAVTVIRSFLRFLVAEGRVPSNLQHCVPTVPQ